MGGSVILLNIVGGVALLIWGTRMVRTGVIRAYGAGVRRALAAGTRNRLSAFLVGMGATAAMQSSTATALMTVSFASREVIGLTPALAIMLGADVGTTLVAQVLSLGIGWLSPALILGGLISFLSASGGRPRHLGRAAIGLGLMLLALDLIVQASAPLRAAESFALVLDTLADEPLLAFLLTILLTWLAHSSLAIVLLVMSLGLGGVIGLELALAMVLGANVGSAIAPVAITKGGPAPARRVPLGNLAMRLVGALAVLPFITHIVPWLALLDDNAARQIVDFHTAFNLALALFFLPLIGPLARGLERLLPASPAADDPGRPRYLDESELDTPAVAIASAARETLRMGDEVARMLTRTIDVFRDNDAKLARAIEADDDIVDRLHEAIKLYLTRVSRGEMDEDEGRRYVDVLTFTTNLEHVGDIIDKNLMELAQKKITNMLTFSEAGMEEIATFHALVVENMQLAFNVFMSGNVGLARRLMETKVVLRDAERRSMERHLVRVGEGRPESLETSSLHLDVIRDFRRINNHLTSVAYPILEAAGELSESRLKSEAAMGREAASGEQMTPPKT